MLAIYYLTCFKTDSLHFNYTSDVLSGSLCWSGTSSFLFEVLTSALCFLKDVDLVVCDLLLILSPFILLIPSNRRIEEAQSPGYWCKTKWYRSCIGSCQEDAGQGHVFIWFCWYWWWFYHAKCGGNHEVAKQARSNCIRQVSSLSSTHFNATLNCLIMTVHLLFSFFIFNVADYCQILGLTTICIWT